MPTKKAAAKKDVAKTLVQYINIDVDDFDGSVGVWTDSKPSPASDFTIKLSIPKSRVQREPQLLADLTLPVA